MKWLALTLFATLLAFSARTASAQEVVPIGNLPQIDDSSPTWWAMSGFHIIRISQSDGNKTPIMRTQIMDARTVEILSRTQAPPLRPDDIRVMTLNGRQLIVVRRYLLTEVKPQDARAVGSSQAALAQRWADSVRHVLPQVAPMPGRFGV
jgi:hypothetical protein